MSHVPGHQPVCGWEWVADDKIQYCVNGEKVGLPITVNEDTGGWVGQLIAYGQLPQKK